MRSRIRKILKGPLVYFFVLGFVVFGLHSFLNGANQEDRDPFTVEVTSADIEWIRSSWEARMKRQPTQQELQGLINRYIRDEILYREAMVMDLDDRDLVIQRRLVQKLTFVFEDLAETLEPTDDELKQYLQDNADKYKVPPTVSFTQVYLNPDKHKDVGKDAADLLRRLQEQNTAHMEAAYFGDASLIPAQYRESSSDDVARALGEHFATEIFKLEDASWQGPIASSYGLHLVFVTHRTEEWMPEFEQIRENVKYDFMYERKNEVVDTAYEAAKSRYTVLVEGLPYE